MRATRKAVSKKRNKKNWTRKICEKIFRKNVSISIDFMHQIFFFFENISLLKYNDIFLYENIMRIKYLCTVVEYSERVVKSPIIIYMFAKWCYESLQWHIEGLRYISCVQNVYIPFGPPFQRYAAYGLMPQQGTSEEQCRVSSRTHSNINSTVVIVIFKIMYSFALFIGKSIKHKVLNKYS